MWGEEKFGVGGRWGEKEKEVKRDKRREGEVGRERSRRRWEGEEAGRWREGWSEESEKGSGGGGN